MCYLSFFVHYQKNIKTKKQKKKTKNKKMYINIGIMNGKGGVAWIECNQSIISVMESKDKLRDILGWKGGSPKNIK